MISACPRANFGSELEVPTAVKRGYATSPHLGTDQFPRLRIGIGENEGVDAADYVLSRFRSTERNAIDDALILASQAVAVWVTQGIDAAMNRFNGTTAK